MSAFSSLMDYILCSASCSETKPSIHYSLPCICELPRRDHLSSHTSKHKQGSDISRTREAWMLPQAHLPRERIKSEVLALGLWYSKDLNVVPEWHYPWFLSQANKNLFLSKRSLTQAFRIPKIMVKRKWDTKDPQHTRK